MVLVTEAPDRDRAVSSLSAPPEPGLGNPGKVTGKDSRGIQSEVENGGEERHCRVARSPGRVQPAIYTEPDFPKNRKKPHHVRSKPAEPFPPVLTQSDYERKLGRKKSQSSQISKTNAQYHKIFKEISKDELLKQSYTCALQKDILYQGKMFVSDNWICFHSKVFGRDTKIAIPVLSVTLIKKTKTAILVPNALVITTTNERHVFVSFLSRDNTFKLLKSICVHLDQVDNTGSSPIPSSCENSFRVDSPASLPLDFCQDFSDLDSVVHQRRQDMLESSSSGSQTPDYEKMAGFNGLPGTFLSAVTNGEVSVHADIHLQTSAQKHGATLQNGTAKPTQGPSNRTRHRPTSLHPSLLIYLFLVSVLVLSSCFMAFKIVALEQRLNSWVSTEEKVCHSDMFEGGARADSNADIYRELSTNLHKLEKIQKNLRKLLQET